MLTFCTAVLIITQASTFEPTDDQCKVNVRWPTAKRDVLIVESDAYTLHLGVKTPEIERFSVGQKDVIGGRGWTPAIDGTPLQGPGRVNIYNFGTQMYEVHIRDLKHPAFPDCDIELAVFAYDKRVFVNINVVATSWHNVTAGWQGESVESSYQYSPNDVDVPTADGFQVSCRLTKEAPMGIKGERTASIVLLAGRDVDEVKHLRNQETRHDAITIKAQGGEVAGYVRHKGFYEVNTIYSGPRSFETAWVNPNQRYEVDLAVSRSTDAEFDRPSNIMLNVRNTYGVLEATVLTDEHGFPLPVPVMTCKNFGGEKEEGRAEGDHPYGEAYIPITVDDNTPFHGRVYHLFGNWGTHPLKQISSIRFFHHYFHASLGPTETMCYVPFEYPRDDDRNYVLADVRGLSNFYWPGQPQHDHVSLVGFLRYKSKGKWINNLLQDTRIYLTAPNIACFAMEYLSEDGAVKTTLNFVETPEDDETRCYVHMRHEVLRDIDIDGGSAQNLRFLNAGSYIVRTRWPKVAFSNVSGETEQCQVPANETWALEAEPLSAETPFVAGYSHKNGNMAFVVQDFTGRLAGLDIDMFGLSVFGGKKWSELILTAPERLNGLKKGDFIDSRLFVMPYGHAALDHSPAERQRYLYGEKAAKLNVTHGAKLGSFPMRLRADERGFADFTVSDGNNWSIILVEGFSTYKAPILWEKVGSQWLFHDQQVHGNDWYQTYRASDGSIGLAVAIKLRPDMKHRYVVSMVPNAIAISQRNGFVTIKGGSIDLISPCRFEGLECAPIDGTDLFQCHGTAGSVTSLRN